MDETSIVRSGYRQRAGIARRSFSGGGRGGIGIRAGFRILWVSLVGSTPTARTFWALPKIVVSY